MKNKPVQELSETTFDSVEQMMNAMDKGVVGVNGYALKTIIQKCHEWIGEGWQLPDNSKITPAQIAASLHAEAHDQDWFVSVGESHPDYPKVLRAFGDAILRQWTIDSQRQRNLPVEKQEPITLYLVAGSDSTIAGTDCEIEELVDEFQFNTVEELKAFNLALDYANGYTDVHSSLNRQEIIEHIKDCRDEDDDLDIEEENEDQ